MTTLKLHLLNAWSQSYLLHNISSKTLWLYPLERLGIYSIPPIMDLLHFLMQLDQLGGCTTNPYP